MKLNNKICNKCGELKSFSEFYKDETYSDNIRNDCKVCYSKMQKRHSKTKDGLISRIYLNQIHNSKRRGDNPPTYSKKELKEWIFSQQKFHELYDNWKNSKYEIMLRPSCDRLNDYKGYSLDRLQLMTWEENMKKSHSDKINGINNKQNRAVIATNIKTGEETEYYSSMNAKRCLSVDSSSVVKCCRGKVKTVGGFYWRYKD